MYNLCKFSNVQKNIQERQEAAFKQEIEALQRQIDGLKRDSLNLQE